MVGKQPPTLHPNERNRHPNRQPQPAPVGTVRLRLVQRPLREQKELSRLQLHRNGALRRHIPHVRHLPELHLRPRLHMRNRRPMRTRYQPHAGGVQRRLVQCNPSGDVQRRLNRPVVHVLMPRNLLRARIFLKEIGAPQQQVRPVETRHAVGHRRMRAQVVHDPPIQMARLMDVVWKMRRPAG